MTAKIRHISDRIAKRDLKACLAESIGTYLLVFVGTGSIVVSAAIGRSAAIATPLAFGVIVFLVTLMFARLSGAIVNPAMTFGLYLRGRLRLRQFAALALSQLTGAVLASLTVRAFSGGAYGLGATKPSAVTAAFGLEALFAFVLFSVVTLTVTRGIAEELSGAFIVGGTVAVEGLLGSSVSGASVNPARSIAPALVSGDLSHVWLYIVAPVAGAALAALAIEFLAADRRPTAVDNLEPSGRFEILRSAKASLGMMKAN
ncbi:MAG: MIP/aquaporin family protein [Candidatus Aquicultorales bacterium]